MRIVLIYPPPWRIPDPQESFVDSADGPPEDYREGDLDPDFYQMPYERFEKYAPYGSAAEVADFLAGYADAGCQVFNIMPVAESDEAGIDAVAEIRQRLLG